jgi:hypothetical protein
LRVSPYMHDVARTGAIARFASLGQRALWSNVLRPLVSSKIWKVNLFEDLMISSRDLHRIFKRLHFLCCYIVSSSQGACTRHGHCC